MAGWHSRDDCSAGHCQTLSTYSLDESVTFNLSCLSLGSDSPLQPAPSTSPPSTSPPGAGPASTSPPGTGPPDSGSPMLSTGPGTPTAIETSTPTRLCATPTGRAGVVQTAVQGLVRVSGLTRVVIAEARATTTQASIYTPSLPPSHPPSLSILNVAWSPFAVAAGWKEEAWLL